MHTVPTRDVNTHETANTARDTSPTVSNEPGRAGRTRHASVRRITENLSVRESGIIVAFVAIIVFLSVDTSQFLTSGNLLSLIDLQTSVGFVALAGTFVILSGAFDLSVGAVYALCGVVAAKLAESTDPAIGFTLAIVAGIGLGVVNGVFVGVARLNALIVTLATSTIIAGVALLLTSGSLVEVSTPGFGGIGGSNPLGVHLSTWILLAFAICMGVLLNRTIFGRWVYAVGGNPEAARLSGVRPAVVHIAVYALSGFSAAIAAVLYTSRVGVADPTAGGTLALTAIAAIVVGGTSIKGGEGAVWRTVVGVLLLGTISDGFNLLGLNPLYQQIVYGAIILIAVSLDLLARSAGRRA